MNVAEPAAEVRKAESPAAAKRLQRLADLESQTGRAIHERAGLAAESIGDRKWLREMGFDEGQAYDYLTSNFFHDLGGLISVEMLVTLYTKVPGALWQEYRWNLKRLIAHWEDASRPQQNGAQVAKSAGKPVEKEPPDPELPGELRREKLVNRELRGELKAAKRIVSDREKEIAERGDEVARLTNRVAELERENAQLKARITDLERRLGK